jgi:putative hemolysin
MKKIKPWVIWITIALCVLSVYGMKNPATVYCRALGYSSETKVLENGDEIGICAFPGNIDCNDWDFMLGKCGTDYSYCAKMGYTQKTGMGAECGSPDYPTAECLICILPNGTKAEVTSLMNLDVNEGICGDGACVIGETPESCPQDCPAVATTMEDVTTTQWDIPTTVEETTMPPQTTQPTITTTTEQPQETTSIPKTSTTLPDLCGNSVCDSSESFDSCPQDCSKPTGPVDYLPYIVIIVVLLLILFVVKKKLDGKKIAKEKAEFEKWKQEKGGTGQ